MIYLYIDRIEGDYAICEESGGQLSEIACELLPKGAGEGDMLALHPDGHLTLDHEEAERRRAMVRELQSKLFD